MPVLSSTHGNAVIEVGDNIGVRVAGFIMEPGTNIYSENLLRWGTGVVSGSASEPGMIQDVFARVGGSNNSSQSQVQVKRMM